MKFNIKLVLVLSLLTLMQGCIRVDTGTTVPTIGDQIIDLARAKQSGLISEEEFRQLKRKALASF